MLVFVSNARQVSMMFRGYSHYITLHFNAPRRARHRGAARRRCSYFNISTVVLSILCYKTYLGFTGLKLGRRPDIFISCFGHEGNHST